MIKLQTQREKKNPEMLNEKSSAGEKSSARVQLLIYRVSRQMCGSVSTA